MEYQCMRCGIVTIATLQVIRGRCYDHTAGLGALSIHLLLVRLFVFSLYIEVESWKMSKISAMFWSIREDYQYGSFLQCVLARHAGLSFPGLSRMCDFLVLFQSFKQVHFLKNWWYWRCKCYFEYRLPTQAWQAKFAWQNVQVFSIFFNKLTSFYLVRPSS